MGVLELSDTPLRRFNTTMEKINNKEITNMGASAKEKVAQFRSTIVVASQERKDPYGLQGLLFSRHFSFILIQ